MLNWIKTEWRQVSTKLGLILAAVQGVTTQFVQYDHRLVFVGYAVAIGLVLFDESAGKPDA